MTKYFDRENNFYSEVCPRIVSQQRDAFNFIKHDNKKDQMDVITELLRISFHIFKGDIPRLDKCWRWIRIEPLGDVGGDPPLL